MTDRAAARAALIAERDEAIRVLRAAADAVSRIEPAAAREPVRGILLAAAEDCGLDWHILGKRVNYPIALARALTAPRPAPEWPDKSTLLEGDGCD